MRKKKNKHVFIHPSAEVDKTAKIGAGTRIWNQVQIREKALIGKNCIIGKGVYIDYEVTIGDNCKIANQVSIYFQTTIKDGVFIGPHSSLINDKIPRAVTPEGVIKKEADWQPGKILVKKGASIGAGCILLPCITVGKWAMVGAGSVVTKNVPDYGLFYGNPARLQGYVCPCGLRLIKRGRSLTCPECQFRLKK